MQGLGGTMKTKEFTSWQINPSWRYSTMDLLWRGFCEGKGGCLVPEGRGRKGKVRSWKTVSGDEVWTVQQGWVAHSETCIKMPGILGEARWRGWKGEMERGGLVWFILQEVRLQRVIWDSNLGPGPATKLKYWWWECPGSRWAMQPFTCSNSDSQVKSCQQSIKSLCLRLSAREHGSETSQFWIWCLPHLCPSRAPLASLGRSPNHAEDTPTPKHPLPFHTSKLFLCCKPIHLVRGSKLLPILQGLLQKAPLSSNFP